VSSALFQAFKQTIFFKTHLRRLSLGDTGKLHSTIDETVINLELAFTIND
jgi:hypothetical protein